MVAKAPAHVHEQEKGNISRRRSSACRTAGSFMLALALFACEPGAEGEDEPVAEPATTDTIRIAAVDSGAPKLLPVDQADDSFAAFREDLLRALAERDTTFLYDIVSPDIRNSFGPDDGIAAFRAQWQPGDSASAVWAVLTRVLQLGGQLRDSTFYAPYVAAFWPDSIDAFEFVAVTSERALVRASPQPDADPIGSASWSILQVEEWLGTGESFVATDTSWVRVRLPAGRMGWLRATDVHGPAAWRAFFQRRDGRWLLVTLLAGD